MLQYVVHAYLVRNFGTFSKNHQDFGARHMACQYASEVVARLNQKKIFSDLPPKAMLAMAAGASHNNLNAQGEVRGWLASCCSLKRPSFTKVVPNQDG